MDYFSHLITSECSEADRLAGINRRSVNIHEIDTSNICNFVLGTASLGGKQTRVSSTLNFQCFHSIGLLFLFESTSTGFESNFHRHFPSKIAACQNKMALTLFDLDRIRRERRFILSCCLRSEYLHIVFVHSQSVCSLSRLHLKLQICCLNTNNNDTVCSRTLSSIEKFVLWKRAKVMSACKLIELMIASYYSITLHLNINSPLGR